MLKKLKSVEDIKQYLGNVIADNLNVFDSANMESLGTELDTIIEHTYKIGQRNPVKVPVKAPWSSDEFLDAWDLWVAFRKEVGKPIKGPISASKQVNKLVTLSNGSEQMAIAIMDQSIENNWQGLFDVKDKKGLTDGIPLIPDMIWYNKQTDTKLMQKAVAQWRAEGWTAKRKQVGTGEIVKWSKA